MIILTKLMLIIVVSMLTGCGSTMIDQGSDPTFNPYYDSFLTEGLNRGVNLMNERRVPITFTDNPTLKAGVCSELGSKRWIEIRRSYWDSITLLEREYMIYHELGHCVLNKDHDSGGIMSNSGFYTYDIYKIEWLNLLFTL